MAYHKCASIYGTANSAASVQTASGAIANFSTQLAMPLIKSRFNFKATQEAGTPTPQSPKAISGVSEVVIGQQSGAVDVAACFRGLFKGTHGFINLGSFTWNYSTEGSRFSTTTPVSDISLASNFTNLVANGYNTISSIVAFSQMQNLDLKRSGSTGYINIRDDSFSGNATNFKNAMNSVYLIYELATPTTPTITPEQYQTLLTAFGINSSTTLINLGGTYYGGYVEQDKDGHRQLLVTHEITDLGEQTWTYSVWGAGYVFSANPSLAKEQAVSSVKGDIICSIYNNITASEMYNYNPNYSMCLNRTLVQIANSDYSDKDTFKTAMNGIMLVYELAEPYTVALPDGQPIKTFPGINNIYADTGDTSLQFIKLGN